jgi:archaemetzincin
VEVVPLGRVSQTAVAVAAANLQAQFGLDSSVTKPWPEPDYALAPGRGQYDAGPILLALAGDGRGPPLRLGLTRHDLCLPFLTHVFGEAQLGGRAAVVSLYRLQGSEQGGRASRSLLLDRLAKIALHEMGHVLGLVHCRLPRCLMNFSQGLANLDQLELRLCPACQSQLVHLRLKLLEGLPEPRQHRGPE